jgi:hypothetical protein
MDRRRLSAAFGIIVIVANFFTLSFSRAETSVSFSGGTPEEAIAFLDEAIIEDNGSAFDEVYYAGDDEVMAGLIKKDFLARARFANRLNELRGNEPLRRRTESEIRNAVENAFMDGSILYVTLDQSNISPENLKDSIKSMRLSKVLPPENKIYLLEKMGEQWRILHPYVAWNRGFRDNDKEFLKERIESYKLYTIFIEAGDRTAEDIAVDHKKYVDALKTIHRIHPVQW